MKHFHDLTVLTTNTETNPVVYEFKIDKGLITEAGIFFPAGVHGVVNAKIFFQAHQIMPRNQESWCHGNNGWWLGALYYPVTTAPMHIKVIAYTVGANYNHIITVCIEIMPWQQVPAWDKLILTLENIAKAFGVKPVKMPITEMTPE